MEITINKAKFNFSPSDVEKLDFTISFFFGRRVSHSAGFKNVSLNALITALKNKALEPGQDKKEIASFIKAFKSVENKGYEKPDGQVYKENFFTRIFTILKHIVFHSQRERLLKELAAIVQGEELKEPIVKVNKEKSPEVSPLQTSEQKQEAKINIASNTPSVDKETKETKTQKTVTHSQESTDEKKEQKLGIDKEKTTTQESIENPIPMQGVKPVFEKEKGKEKFNLGVELYIKGQKDEGKKLVLEAAGLGNTLAKFQMGIYCEFEKNPSQAYEWFSDAARDGHAEAQYLLGQALEYGKGIAKDPELALHWYDTSYNTDNRVWNGAAKTCAENLRQKLKAA